MTLRIPISRAAWGLAGALFLPGCATPPPPAPQPARAVEAPRHETGFDCSEIEFTWQAYVCRDESLAALDRRIAQLRRERLRHDDLVGREDLLDDQRHWLLGIASACATGARRPAEDAPLPAGPLACLQQTWQARGDTLQAAATRIATAPTPARPSGDHPLAAYVALHIEQEREPALCGELTAAMNELVARDGDLDPGRLPLRRRLAGSHGATRGALEDGRPVDVEMHDAGPYGGYAQRPTELRIGEAVAVDATTVSQWTRELPNGGGSYGNGVSQTNDYGAIDVFAQGPRVFVLVAQTWGYDASAVRGESPHAALYEIAGAHLERRCLWRTYTTPPRAQPQRFVPRFRALREMLEEAAGEESMNVPAIERRDAALFFEDAQWQVLNMPLVALHEARQQRSWPLLRQRNDEAMEAVFAWSERNVPCKLLYRRLMPAVIAARAELADTLQHEQGLTADEAGAAADLLLATTLTHWAERLRDPAAKRPLPAGDTYVARYAPAPALGDLERGRPYGSLHSALLGRAPAPVIDEFLHRSEAATSRGPASDTLLMAAVRNPASIERLLAAGAGAGAANDWGKTPLMTAAQADQADSVALLLKAGADPNARTSPWHAEGAGGPDNAEGAHPGRTALMMAAASASPPTIDALLAAGADPRALDDTGHDACALLPDNPRLQEQRTALRAQLCLK